MTTRDKIPTLLQEKKRARICDQSENAYRRIERVFRLHAGMVRNALPAVIGASEHGTLRIHEFIISHTKDQFAIPPDRRPRPLYTIDFSLSSRPEPYTVRLNNPDDRYISIYPKYHDCLIHMNRGVGLQDDWDRRS